MTNDTTPAPIGADALPDTTLFALLEEHLGLRQRRDDTVIDPSTGRYHDAQRYRALLRAALGSAAQPALTVTARYDLSPAAIEGAIRDKLIEMGWTPPDAAAPKAAPAQQSGVGYAELERAEVDRIVYACRQAGDDSTYAVVNAALRASRGQAPAGTTPLPLLARDIAADFGVTPVQVCLALVELGFGHLSVNMAITPEMAEKLREYFAHAAQPAPAPAAVEGPKKLAPYEPTSAMISEARRADPALPIETIRALWFAMWRAAPTTQAAPAAVTGPIFNELDQSEIVRLLTNSDLWEMHQRMGWYSNPERSFKAHGAKLVRAIERTFAAKNNLILAHAAKKGASDAS